VRRGNLKRCVASPVRYRYHSGTKRDRKSADIVRVMNLRSGAGFAQKARASDWIFGQLPADNLECNDGI
jgi:hypothetical protein